MAGNKPKSLTYVRLTMKDGEVMTGSAQGHIAAVRTYIRQGQRSRGKMLAVTLNSGATEIVDLFQIEKFGLNERHPYA